MCSVFISFESPRFHWCSIEPDGMLRIEGMTNMGMYICHIVIICTQTDLRNAWCTSLCISLLDRIVKRFPDIPLNSLTALRYCAQRYFGFVLFHQTTNQSIFPVNPSMLQYHANIVQSASIYRACPFTPVALRMNWSSRRPPTESGSGAWAWDIYELHPWITSSLDLRPRIFAYVFSFVFLDIGLVGVVKGNKRCSNVR
jgi:hypothetical protein